MWKFDRFWRCAMVLPVWWAVALCGCDDPPATPGWELEENPSESVAPAAAQAEPVVAVGDPTRVRFINHNVENWLSMPRTVDGERVEDASKPEEEKAALIAMIARHQPDVFGISEVGTPADLADIRERLRAAGVDLP